MTAAAAPRTDDFGNQLSELTSTSEAFQMVALAAGLASGIGASFVFLADVSMDVWLTCGVIMALAICLLAKRLKKFSTKMTVFDRGMEIIVNGKLHRFLFSDVDQYSMSHTHEHSRVAGNDLYIGSRVVTELLLDGRFSAVRCDCEYHKQKPSYDTVRLIGEKLCEAVEIKLANELETSGEIQLTDDVFLTLDGLRIVDPLMNSQRTIAIEEIETWQYGDDGEVKLFKQGSGLPFLCLSMNGTNFAAAFSLFAKLHESLTQPAAAV